MRMRFVAVQKRRLLYRLVLYLLFTIFCTIFVFGLYYMIDEKIPSTIYLHAEKESCLEFHVPATGKLCPVGNVGKSNIPAQEIMIDFNAPVMLGATEAKDCLIDVKLFGFLPFKQVDIKVLEQKSLTPVGLPIGMYIETDGLMVVGIGEFENMEGKKCAPAKAKLHSGDYITALNHQSVSDKKEFIEAVRNSGGKDVVLTILRDEKNMDVNLTPVKDENGDYKLGIWVRHNSQGVGTMTYIDEDGNFGALGHGINDIDTGTLVKLQDGTLYRTQIVGIKKGTEGAPGEMTGRIVYQEENILGDITVNSKRGIFGCCNEQGLEMVKQDPLPIGLKQEVEEGPAEIICTFEDGEAAYYDVMITGVHMNHENINRGIELQIVDPKLLAKTGGIVQGMSGSPIVQNGKLIGAVTHVFVDDPTKGYGIFIESMLN